MSKDLKSIPDRWLNCPRMATGVIVDKFFAFKTPLANHYKVQDVHKFTPSMLFGFTKSKKINIGLWIDLTNTSRFYDKSEIEKQGCKYVKHSCRGHGETPSKEQTDRFIALSCKFQSEKPQDIIAVHCTHGFNRTGFLIVSYMVEQLSFSVDAALLEFAKMRPPGIYKQDYIYELYRRYDEVEYVMAAPERPGWCFEEQQQQEEEDEGEEEENGENEETPGNSQSDKKKKRKGKPETNKVKDVFMPGVTGVEPFNDQTRISKIREKAQRFCHWESTGFPGSQPVSMSLKNLEKITKKPYRVSWKADGVRCLMLIDGEDEVYLLDRDNCVFKVKGLRFLHRSDLQRHLRDTLLDGEMVIDKVEGKEIPRYLCYDIISFEGHDVGKKKFYPDRLKCIEYEIIYPRHCGMKAGLLRREAEAFSVRLKQFWALGQARQLLGDKFARSLSHEPDGLIFQPADEAYVAGQCLDVLKWKPSYMNSIDFRLKIVVEEGLGILPRKVGYLYVGQRKTAFGDIKLTKELRQLDGKIIECKWDNDHWTFMRERTDKSFPNAEKTALSVAATIKNPVSTELLLSYTDRFQQDAIRMPPPAKVRRLCEPTQQDTDYH